MKPDMALEADQIPPEEDIESDDNQVKKMETSNGDAHVS